MATDCIYRKTTGSASMDCADLSLTGALQVAGAANIAGALAVTSTLTATGGILANGTVVVSNGTAPTLPAGVVAFYGTGGANHAIVFPTAIGMQGRTMFVYEYGSGTTTATGFGTQLIHDNGTQAYTPGKYGEYISDGANWRFKNESV
jgi:hypothetical protein